MNFVGVIVSAANDNLMIKKKTKELNMYEQGRFSIHKTGRKKPTLWEGFIFLSIIVRKFITSGEVKFLTQENYLVKFLIENLQAVAVVKSEKWFTDV